MKLAFMIAQKHLENNHNLANIDISGIIICNMGFKQELMGENPNGNVTNGPPPIEGLAPLSPDWQPYGDRLLGKQARGPHDLTALREALGGNATSKQAEVTEV